MKLNQLSKFYVITKFFVTFFLFYYIFDLLEFINFFQEGLLTLGVIVYTDLETDRSKILSENKGKTAIYQWSHLGSGKTYVGSAFDLSKRLKKYFRKSYLEPNKTRYINNALLHYGYSAFSLTILEYIDISNLSIAEARKLILEREQFYIDSLEPVYNIAPIAGSRLGSKHTEESKDLMRGENNHMFGKFHTEETKAKMSEAQKGRSLSANTKSLISKAISGENHPMFGKKGNFNPRFGKSHTQETKDLISKGLKGVLKSKEHKAKISLAKNKKVFVYSFDSISNEIMFHVSFNSYKEAANYFICSRRTLANYVDKNILYKKQWFLYTSEQISLNKI